MDKVIFMFQKVMSLIIIIFYNYLIIGLQTKFWTLTFITRFKIQGTKIIGFWNKEGIIVTYCTLFYICIFQLFFSLPLQYIHAPAQTDFGVLTVLNVDNG